jgi:hypothetical protein
MTSRNLMTPRLISVAIGAVAGMLLAGGVAFATIPGTGGLISGCYEKRIGILRVIDKEAGKPCTSFETPISWNQQGPQGLQGPKGDPGPQGPVDPTLAAQIRELQAQLNAAREQIVALQAGHQSQVTATDGLRSQFGGLSTDVTGLGRDFGSLRTEFGSLKTVSDGLQSQINDVKTRLDDLKSLVCNDPKGPPAGC